ncbi:hypothetical protein [Derxia gummosa]|uniref:Uncharacterized protein n=1 Tax=Derxia gummosa DSM 723 TaxID=1121388 RepID=A0A8B6X166_9BURK|nr:hypothetical protein [Derxia gummosa]
MAPYRQHDGRKSRRGGVRTVLLRELLDKTPLSALELMQPKLAKEIALLWGHPEMARWFERHIYDVEPGTPPIARPVMEDIAFLQTMHLELARLRLIDAKALPDALPALEFRPPRRDR